MRPQESVVVREIAARPLRVPLVEPFVIATASIEETAALEIAVTIEREGARFTGLGEAATLPPVTRESPAEVEAWVEALSTTLTGAAVEASPDALAAHLRGVGPVGRAGIETAWLDALARSAGESLRALLARHAGPLERATELVHETDVTLPIAAPDHMGELARLWWDRGFRALKIKVGRALEDDLAAIRAIVASAPAARLRLDANAALSGSEALRLLERARALGADIELFEQPCRTEDLAGMAEVVGHGRVPVVADESCKSVHDVDRLADLGAATGVNLKLVKNGGPLASLAVGLRARERGLTVMAGAMVETRLGLAAMLHVVSALGGVEHVDLDTALLLAADPYVGGYSEALPRLVLVDGPDGVGVRRR